MYDYYSKCVLIINSFIDRENGDWKSFTDTGEDFLDKAPYYYRDLDIFGDYSLFQFLSVCKTVGGRNRLRDRLSNVKYSDDRLKREQEAVNELSLKKKFLIDFLVLLSFYDGKRVDLSSDFSSSLIKRSSIFRDLVIGIVCSLVCITLLVLAILGIISIRYFYGMFLFNFMISFMYSYIYNSEFIISSKLVNSYKGINPIFNRCVVEDFSSLKLNNMKKDMEKGLKGGTFLKRLDAMDSLRNNVISNFLFNGLFCINFIFFYVFYYFSNQDLNDLKKGIEDIEELEAISSLAGIGICFDNKCMPVIRDDIGISFDNLIHPLLGEKVCVPNSISSSNGVNIITGSNMGGKTSFLRTIGINLILMNSGCFVLGKSFNSSYFKIFTSMRVNDDISNGISTFYGELLRIKDMVNYVDKGNMIVFIDEIFKGTNYQDRIYGAKEVIKRLNTDNTVVMLTTHDFELCEENNVNNYHVKEDYEGEKIIFDYKIRKGKCTSTNARYLMAKLGIISK